MNMIALTNDFAFIAAGLALTVKVTLASTFISIIFGTILAILKHIRVGKIAIDCFISIIRGTPLLVQLSLIYFAMPQMLDIKLSVLSASIIAFSLNSSAYTAEILRGGIKSVPLGQFEAAKSLHIPTFFMWKDIILPQVVRNVFPTIIHEITTLVKETALISMIGGMEVTRRAQVVAAEKFTYFMPLFMAAATYYVVVLMLAGLSKKIEKKMKYDKER